MSHSVCPWWMGYVLACPLRRLIQNPDTILAPYIKPGMTILEIGPGMGFFTLPAARMLAGSGRIICLDIQEKMLKVPEKRGEKDGLSKRIQTRVVPPHTLAIHDLAHSVDVALLFAVLHEIPDAERVWRELYLAMKPEGLVLFAEPSGHVSEYEFSKSIMHAEAAGFKVTDSPMVCRSRTAVLRKAE